MTAVSFYWDTNMAAVTSCENALYAPPRTRQHIMSDNESVTKVIASFYRDDSDTVYLGLDLRSDIIPANFL